MALTNGKMIVLIKVNGRIIWCMARGSSNGLTEEYIRELTKKIKEKVLGCTNGLMVDAMKVIGKIISSMAKESCIYGMNKLLKVFGLMAKK